MLSANSMPQASARCTTRLLSAKLVMYYGAFSEMSQPLLLIGMKTPISTDQETEMLNWRATAVHSVISRRMMAVNASPVGAGLRGIV